MVDNKPLFYAISAMVFISPFVFIKGIFHYSTVPQAAFIQVASVLILVASLITIAINKGRVQIIRHPINIVVLGFFIWTLVLSFYAHNTYESFTIWSQWATCGLVFFMFQQIRLSKEMIIRLLSGIYITGVIVSILGICQHLFQLNIIPQSAPPAATFANRNMAAQFIVLTLPLSVLIFKKKKWLVALSSVAMLTFLYFTACRAGWIAVGAEIVLVAFILNGKSRNKVMIVLIGVVLLLGTSFIAQESKSISAQQRFDVWANTIEMIKDKPIVGYGPGNFRVYYSKYQKGRSGSSAEIFNETMQIVRAHNDPLQFIAETGMIGAIILVSGLGLFFIGIARVLYKKDDKFYIAMGVGVALSGIIVNSCFSFPFYLPVPLLLVAVYLAVGLSLFEAPIAQSPQIVTALCVILFIPVFIYLTQYQYKVIKQDKYYLYTKYFEKNRSWKKVVLLADKGYSLNPHKKKFLAFVGRGCIESGQTYKAIDALEKVAEAYPYHMNTLLNLGIGYHKIGQEQKALACFDRVLDIKPDFAKVYINIAITRLKLNQNELALIAFEKAKAIEPEYFK